MKISQHFALFTVLGAANFCQAQSMFRGDAAHSGSYLGPAPRQFHRLKWKFATGNRIVSSPVIDSKRIYFGGDDGNVYAVDAETGRQIWKCTTRGPVSSSPAVANGIVYATSYDGKLYALNSDTGAVKWKFATGGERRFEAKGLHGMQPKTQTIADPFDVFLSSPVIVKNTVYFGSGDGNVYCPRCRDRRTTLEIYDRRCRARVSGLCGWGIVFRKLGQLLLCGRCSKREGEVALPRWRGSPHS